VTDSAISLDERLQPPAAGLAPAARRVIRGEGLLAAVWADHRPFLLAASSFIVGSQLVGALAGWRGMAGLWTYYALAAMWCAISAPLTLLVLLFRERLRAERACPTLSTSAAWRTAARHVRDHVLTPRRVAGFLAVILVVPPTLATFNGWKVSIPLFQPFAWDHRLMVLDRLLHGGADPWALLQPVLGFPAITTALGYVYGAGWLSVTNFAVFVAAWDTDSARRNRFFVTYVLAWALLGCAMATGLSSAGPCYFAAVAGGTAPDPYAPLMAYLRDVIAVTPIPSVVAQEALWRAQERGLSFVGAGVSAMPSLHVAMATLVCLYAARRGRLAGAAAAAFAILILVGSVHLGWHYAVDGYVSALCVAALWWALGRAPSARRARRVRDEAVPGFVTRAS